MIKLFGNRVLVKREAQKEKTDGGLYIPDAAKEKSDKGEVVALGQGMRLEDGSLLPIVDVKIGDTVLFQSFIGWKITLNQQEYLAIDYDELQGVFE